MSNHTLTDEDFEPGALAALDSDRHVLLTGRAGTGKTTLLHYWLQTRKPGGVIVVAPTGLAALNAGGETIHRYLHVRPDLTVSEMGEKGRTTRYRELYRATRVIVMDEVSMCRADLMDGLDRFLREARRDGRPFGGVRMILVGDPMQLPPVVTRTERRIFTSIWPSPWYFDSQAYQRILHDNLLMSVNLTVVHRQSDPLLIRALNSVRGGQPPMAALNVFNQHAPARPDGDAIILTMTNEDANRINHARLDALPGQQVVSRANMQGDWEHRPKPAPTILGVKPGARVMMLANDPGGLYVNGSMGTITGWENQLPVVTLDDGTAVLVGRHAWEQTESYAYRDDHGEWQVGRHKVGVFEQWPFKLGWAITVHKSQGMTFDHVHIQLQPDRSPFENGQTYVALSRCRTLDGLTLSRPLTPRDVKADPRAVAYVRRIQQHR